MALKLDARVAVEGAVELGAWLFLPEEDGLHLAITMARGFAATKEQGLERFAKAFAGAGFVMLVHDHRIFGTSGADLHGDIDPWQQIADWRRAFSYVESRPDVDSIAEHKAPENDDDPRIIAETRLYLRDFNCRNAATETARAIRRDAGNQSQSRQPRLARGAANAAKKQA